MHLKGLRITAPCKAHLTSINCHGFPGSMYKRDVIFSLSIKQLSYKSIIHSRHFAHIRTMRSDLIFQSQFCACLILGPAYNCHAVRYMPYHHGLWNSLRLALLIHKFISPSLWVLSSIVLLRGCPLGACRYTAPHQAPPWARVTESAGKPDAQVILLHNIIWPPARVV